MCDCFSYNWQEGETPPVLLDPNKYIEHDGDPLKQVSVDACIADQVKMLWQSGVWTEGSCCGHNGEFFNGRVDGRPYVIVSSSADAEAAVALLKEHDPDRNWRVLQWQLVNASEHGFIGSNR